MSNLRLLQGAEAGILREETEDLVLEYREIVQELARDRNESVALTGSEVILILPLEAFVKWKLSHKQALSFGLYDATESSRLLGAAAQIVFGWRQTDA